MAAPKCFWTKADFVTAIGTVNAEVEHPRQSPRIVIFRTKYAGVAERIESLARTIAADILRTVTDDGVYVLRISNLYARKGARGIWGNQ